MLSFNNSSPTVGGTTIKLVESSVPSVPLFQFMLSSSSSIKYTTPNSFVLFLWDTISPTSNEVLYS